MDKFEQIAAMNQAAKEAEEELLGGVASEATQHDAVMYVAAWWSNWYLTAGHKRLGRILVKLNKEGG